LDSNTILLKRGGLRALIILYDKPLLFGFKLNEMFYLVTMEIEKYNSSRRNGHEKRGEN